MTNEPTIEILGAGVDDDVFTTEVPGLPVISWNVTRMQAAADAGKFGPPITIRRVDMPELGPAEIANIDWFKVTDMVRAYNAMRLGGTEPKDTFLFKPTLSVMLRHQQLLVRLPVDGNHRILARFMLGADDFQSYVVPLEQEIDYRVRVYMEGVEIGGEHVQGFE